jgi:hypothetical protein
MRASRAKKEHSPLHAGTCIQFRGQAFMQTCIALGVQYGLGLPSHCIADLASSDPLLFVSSAHQLRLSVSIFLSHQRYSTH